LKKNRQPSPRGKKKGKFTKGFETKSGLDGKKSDVLSPGPDKSLFIRLERISKRGRKGPDLPFLGPFAEMAGWKTFFLEKRSGGGAADTGEKSLRKKILDEQEGREQ